MTNGLNVVVGALALGLAFSASHALAGSLPTGRQVVPPTGFIGFCLRNVADCEGGVDNPSMVALTEDRRRELAEVNEAINRSVPQIEDEDNYGTREYWAYPNERGGDCEDIALAKRKALVERGWPADALLMTVVEEWRGGGHAVLTVVTDRGEFVLDNKTDVIRDVTDTSYSFIKRQSRERPYVWVSLDQPAFMLTEVVYPPLGAPVPFIEAAQRVRTETASTK